MITVDSGALEVDTRKAIALLAYLAIEKGVTRDTAAALFWADASEERAKASLRRTLSALRSGAGDLVTADRSQISLSPDATCDVDVFERELSATRQHDHDAHDVCSRCIPHLKSATDLYRGDFLTGFTIRDAPEFEDWARAVGESLRLRAGEAFHRLGMAYSANGEYQRAIDAATRWSELDPLHEPAHRFLMLLNAWAGDRPGSVEAYRRFVAILDSELGVPPLDETTELLEAILDEDLPPAPGARRAAKPTGIATPHPSDMLNRHEELAELRGVGVGNLVEISGAAWMGKTRLIEEFEKEIQQQSGAVLVARAFRMEENLPFGVVAQLLRACHRVLDQATDRVPDWALQEAARIYPQIWTGQATAEPDPIGELRTMEAVESILGALGGNRTVVVVVEDLQWVDSASAGVLLYLANRISQLPILLIMTSRTGEHMSASARDMLKARSHRILLGPLTPETLESHIEDGVDADELIRSTGGVPLLVAEKLTGIGAGQESGIALLIETRLANVSDLAGQLVSAAATLGGTFTTDLLQNTSGRSDDELVEGVEELLNAGILRELPGDRHLGFTLDAMADLVYQGTSLIRRRHLHRRAANSLSALAGATTDARSAHVVATHFAMAGDESAAAAWYHRAGDLSKEIFAHVEARIEYESALALGDPDIAGIRLKLGEISITQGDYDTALVELATAAPYATGSRLALVEHRLGQANRHLGRFELSMTNFERALADHPERADLHTDMALLFHRMGMTEDARSAAELALAESITDSPSVRTRALNISAVTTEDPSLAMMYLDEALAIAGEDAGSRIAVLNNRAHLLAASGRPQEAIVLIEEAVATANETGQRHREAVLLDQLAGYLHRTGDAERAKVVQQQAVSLFADIDEGRMQPEVWFLSQW